MFIGGQYSLRYHSHQSSATKFSLKIIFLWCYWNLPGANELRPRSCLCRLELGHHSACRLPCNKRCQVISRHNTDCKVTLTLARVSLVVMIFNSILLTRFSHSKWLANSGEISRHFKCYSRSFSVMGHWYDSATQTKAEVITRTINIHCK